MAGHDEGGQRIVQKLFDDVGPLWVGEFDV